MERIGSRLAEAVSGTAIHFGFRSAARKGKFIRKTCYGFDEFLWTCYPTLSNDVVGQHYSLIVLLRHDLVEAAVNRLDLIYGLKNQKALTTICCPYEIFPPSSDRTYSFFLPNLASDQEMAKVAEAVADVLTMDAIPFFKRYSSLEACALDLNSSPRSMKHFLSNHLEFRMYHAVASAFLAGLSEFDSILQQWWSTCNEVLPEQYRSTAEARLNKLLHVLTKPDA